MTTVRQTSIDTYHSPSFQGMSGCIRAQIADLLARRGPMTRREIAAELHLETGNVSGRCAEMLDDDEPVIAELPELAPCPITKRRVHWLVHRDWKNDMQRGLGL